MALISGGAMRVGQANITVHYSNIHDNFAPESNTISSSYITTDKTRLAADFTNNYWGPTQLNGKPANADNSVYNFPNVKIGSRLSEYVSWIIPKEDTGDDITPVNPVTPQNPDNNPGVNPTSTDSRSSTNNVIGKGDGNSAGGNKGNVLSNKTVSIIINGVTYTRTTDDKGTASIGLGLDSGVYNVTVTVDDESVISVVTILPTVNGSDLVKIFRNGTQYYATFRDSEGNYLKDGTVVRFNIHGVMYDRTVSGGKGLAKLNINLEQGEYIITAINLVTGESRANKITVIPRLVENNDITKYYRNGTQYTVKVLGDDGKPVGAGIEVTFNINGVFYTRTTNESGIVKLNINLQPGDYIITAGYDGCLVSNKIKVLPVLTAKDLTKKYGTKDQFVATLVDGQGKAYADQTVQFNINGVFYNRITDSNGQAKLNINLQPGQYIITSGYDNSYISNKVTVIA